MRALARPRGTVSLLTSATITAAVLAAGLLLLVAASRVHAIITTAGKEGFLGAVEPLLLVLGFALLVLTAFSIPLVVRPGPEPEGTD